MKSKLLLSTCAAAVLSIAGCSSMAQSDRVDLLGDPAPLSAAGYTVLITPDIRYVNVKLGDIVRFDAGGQSFAWNFDAQDNVWMVNLNQIAPTGLLDHPVIAYVSPFRRYFGRNDS
jgi:hypothetical protein